jgi:hypothetical protein
MINPHIATPQIYLVFQPANLKGKGRDSDPDPHWFASNTFLPAKVYFCTTKYQLNLSQNGPKNYVFCGLAEVLSQPKIIGLAN